MACSSSTKYDTGRSRAAASFSSVVMVGTMVPCSTLWMAAVDTSDRLESCCSESFLRVRSRRILGPIELTTAVGSLGAVSAAMSLSGASSPLTSLPSAMSMASVGAVSAAMSPSGAAAPAAGASLMVSLIGAAV